MHAVDGPDRTIGKSSSTPKILANLMVSLIRGLSVRVQRYRRVLVLDHQARMTNLLTRVGWSLGAVNQEEKSAGQESAERLIAADTRGLPICSLWTGTSARHLRIVIRISNKI